MKIRKKEIGYFVLIFVCAAILTGCFGRAKTSFVMDQYTLDYTSPKAGPDQRAIEELITVERFAVASQFNSTSMMIRTGQYRFDTYDYSRWHVNPADMITGFVLRDITRSGMFKGTYSYYDTGLSRYTLEGYIDEFGETTDGKALVSIRITLLDTSRKNPIEQIVFQKQYVHSAPIGDRSANGLAAGLSQATKDLSARLIADIGLALNATAAK
ncbi:MAG: hypothetical protein H6Q52_1914 [Deltaproteobacteria bacterium]|nr:hypothetical protein [Deltaproteobacteria bacterium]